MFKRFIQILMALGFLATLAACNSDYPRGQFGGYVLNKTEEQIVAQVGKPARVDNSNPDRPIWIFTQKTFDVDNYNKLDKETHLYMKKAADGKWMGDDLSFFAG